MASRAIRIERWAWLLWLVACAASSAGEVAPAAPAASAERDPGSTAAPQAGCLSDEDCPDGVCEGEGCGPESPGHCAPRVRACTKDLRAYCGCDGRTFRTSGSCPGRRYASRGPCPPADGTSGAEDTAEDTATEP